MQIKILGTGCAKCKKLYQQAEQAVALSGVSAELSKVESLPDIMAYGVVMTPALVIDEQVVSSGKIPGADKIAQWILAAKG